MVMSNFLGLGFLKCLGASEEYQKVRSEALAIAREFIRRPRLMNLVSLGVVMELWGANLWNACERCMGGK